MNRFYIILSLLAVLLLPTFCVSETKDSYVPPVNRMETLISDLKTLATDLKEWDMATDVFILQLSAIIDKYENKICPPDFEGLLDEVNSLAREIYSARKSATKLRAKRDSVSAAISNATKSGDPARAASLKKQLAAVNDRLFKAESVSLIINEDWLRAFTKIYAKRLRVTCPDDMVFIEGSFCIDTYEFPNREGVRPVVNVSYIKSEMACRSVGKRLCSEFEWSRACEGPACRLSRDALVGVRPSECNAGLDLRRDAPLLPSGASPECVTPEGVMDVFGNAWEWTAREYHGRYRVARGGSGLRERVLSCDNSTWGAPDAALPFSGFRCCSDPGVPVPKPAPAPAKVQAEAATDTTRMP